MLVLRSVGLVLIESAAVVFKPLALWPYNCYYLKVAGNQELKMRQVNKIPGYKSIAEFERVHKLPEGTGKRHMQRGYCKWPRLERDECKTIHIHYKLWRSVIDRTTVKGHTSYKNYGGRGIRIHGPWFADFWLFVKHLESLGPKPTPQHTLDRVDNNGNYEPGNLRWASKSEQNENQRLAKDNTSGRRGLTYHSRDGLWVVNRQINTIKYRKQFKSRIDAEAYLDQVEKAKVF